MIWCLTLYISDSLFTATTSAQILRVEGTVSCKNTFLLALQHWHGFSTEAQHFFEGGKGGRLQAGSRHVVQSQA